MTEFGKRWKEKHSLGMKVRPFIPCPACGKKTNAKFHCPHCGIRWSSQQIQLREEQRRKILENYPEELKTKLRNEGYLYWLK